MVSALIFDLVKLALYIAFGYLAFSAYARRSHTSWLLALANKRFAILTLLTLLVLGIKVFEDVIAKESGPIDTEILWFIRQNVPVAFAGFFELVTLSGAGVFLVPATAVLASLLFWAQQRSQAYQLAASMVCAWLLTYALKELVGRSRPELWNADWYWGSSFPSGHTLSTAAFATSLALSAARIWPRAGSVALFLAAIWIGLMGLSRLVLGVHWPTDVMAAICLGVFVPLAISLLLGSKQNKLARAPPSS